MIVALFEGGLGLLAWLLARLLGQPFWDTIVWQIDAVVWGILATTPLLGGLLLLVRSRREPLARLRRLVEQLVAEMFAGAGVADLAVISLLAGVGEELLFRAVLQGAMSEWIGVPAALIVASVFFGLAHLVTKTYAVLATVVGLYLGGLWLYFDNLLVPIVVHALYDFVALTYLIRRGQRETLHAENGSGCL